MIYHFFPIHNQGTEIQYFSDLPIYKYYSSTDKMTEKTTEKLNDTGGERTTLCDVRTTD